MESGNVVSRCHYWPQNISFEFYDYRTLTLEEMGMVIDLWAQDKRNRRLRDGRIVVEGHAGIRDAPLDRGR